MSNLIKNYSEKTFGSISEFKDKLKNEFTFATGYSNKELNSLINNHTILSGVHLSNEMFAVRDNYNYVWAGVYFCINGHAGTGKCVNTETQSKPSFEESIKIIDTELSKKRGEWTLTSVTHMDYNDVSNIIRHHIYKKWDLYDHTWPLATWVRAIINNQTINQVRNNYSNYSRPCLRCPANQGDDLCSIYNKQCSKCELYAKWEKTRQQAYNVKLPLSLDYHTQEIHDTPSNHIDIEKTAVNLHKKMKDVLTHMEYKIYKYLYIDNKDENKLGSYLGFKSNEINRAAGYRQIKNIKESIIKKVKKVIYDCEIDMVP